MSTFAFTVGQFDDSANTVPVTFTVDGNAYSRDINAVVFNGTYDESGTTTRVLQVGMGLLAKISVGAVQSDAERAAAAAAAVPADPSPIDPAD